MVDFARSERSTLGVEWELGLVDPATLDLVPRAGEVLEAIAGTPLADRIVGEMLTNTIEVVSGVHRFGERSGRRSRGRDRTAAAGAG